MSWREVLGRKGNIRTIADERKSINISVAFPLKPIHLKKKRKALEIKNNLIQKQRITL